MIELTKKTADQASTLRGLNENYVEPLEELTTRRLPTRVISVTSGKGGVGKTAFVVNAAISLARSGKKVLIIDADLGLANVDVALGLTPRFNLNHFFAGEQDLLNILVNGPDGVRILPAGSGVKKFTLLDSAQKIRFIEELDALHEEFDVVLIDTESGISDNVIYFNIAAQDIMIITTPEPTAITDAYAMMKLLSTKYHERNFSLIINLVRDDDEALDVYRKLTMVSNRYLDISINFLGSIPFDRRMYSSIRSQKAMVELHPDNKTSNAFEKLAASLVSESAHVTPKGSLQFFWKNFMSFGGCG
jgi:flagellar biosynthesis protein FlhG